MKKLLFLFTLFLPTLLFSQTLKEFDLQEMSEQQIPVFVEHPNEAAFVFYTAINGFTVESSTGGIVKIQSEATKVTVFLKPERQILTFKAPGFIEKKLSIENLSAKQARFYRVNELETAYTTETGSFKIQTQPDGALLRIEGIPTFKQLTPFDLKDFEAKKYRFNLTKPDYYPLDTLVEIRQGMKQSGVFVLRSMYGTLSLRSSLPVKVQVGTQTIDAGPETTNLRLRDGEYQVVVNDNRVEPYRDRVLIESGKVKILDLPLVKKAGFLQITHPDAFAFTLNSETRQKKPGTDLVELFEGSYRAVVKLPGFKPMEYSFTIRKGEVINWEPVFTPLTVLVKLTTEPEGATVFVQRGAELEVLGFTPLEEQISIGEVDFLVKLEGFTEYRFKAKFEEGIGFKKTINLSDQNAVKNEDIKVIKYGALNYNGYNYKTVVIGDQEWMVENLKTTHYNDGTPIPKIVDNTEWSTTTSGSYCAYGNNESNVATYGYLYNWFSVNTGRLAPIGWRVPTDDDWNKLVTNVGWKKTVSLKLKAKSGWYNKGNGTDDFGFSALPGGNRNSKGYFSNVGYYCFWWSFTPVGTYYAWNRYLSYDNAEAYKGNSKKSYGFSVRLVRDL